MLNPPPHSPVRPVATRPLVAALLVAVLGLTLVAADTHVVGASPITRADWAVSEEQQFVDLINNLRASKGLGTLSIDGELVAQGRSWSRTMADRGSIFHAADLSVGVSANWQKLGENVGVGGDVRALFDAFVASPSHYDNLVDPSFTRIGVGVLWSGDRMFTAHRFMALMPTPAPTNRSDEVITRPAPAPADALAAASSSDSSPPAPTPAPVAEAEPPVPARTPPPADPATVRARFEALAALEPSTS